MLFGKKLREVKNSKLATLFCIWRLVGSIHFHQKNWNFRCLPRDVFWRASKSTSLAAGAPPGLRYYCAPSVHRMSAMIGLPLN